jgi:3-oxoacyl-[acyl-carrier protein] reductase
MKDLSVLIVGGGAGLGALLAQMAVEAGAAKIGIIDINQQAAESALGPAKAKGLPTVAATCDIQAGPQ